MANNRVIAQTLTKVICPLITILLISNCGKNKSFKYQTISLKADKKITLLSDSVFWGVIVDMKYENGHIYLLDNSPSILESNLKFDYLGRIHNIGKGPNEFTGIVDFDISKNKLFIYDSEQAKILIYNKLNRFVRAFTSGNFANGFKMAVSDKGNIFLSTPFNRKPIVKLDFEGRLVRTFGNNSADPESFNVLRNWRMLFIIDDKLTAVSKSDPLIKVFSLNGELLSTTVINHPLLEKKIKSIKKSYKKPSPQGALRLAYLFYDAAVHHDKLYLLPRIKVGNMTGPKFAFVLVYKIKDNGTLIYTKEYKLFKFDKKKQLYGIALASLNKHKLLIFDRNSNSIFLFKDEEI